MTPDDPRPPSTTDIVIFETLPNDLTLVAGVISAAPQTPMIKRFIGKPAR